MESILIYLVPGLITFFIMKLYRPEIPRETSSIHVVISLILYSIVNYIFMITFSLIIISIRDNINILAITLRDVYTMSLFENESFALLLLVATVSILVSFAAINEILKRFEKIKGYTMGSSQYVGLWKTYSRLDSGASKGVKIYHHGKLVTKGFLLSDYVYPWQLRKEIIVGNILDFDDEKFIEQIPEYTYYDITDEYMIEVYEIIGEEKYEEN